MILTDLMKPLIYMFYTVHLTKLYIYQKYLYKSINYCFFFYFSDHLLS